MAIQGKGLAKEAKKPQEETVQPTSEVEPPITSVAGLVSSEILPPDAGQQPQVTIGVYVEEQGYEEFPTEVLSVLAPEGFPDKLLPYLAEFMAKGFNAAIRNWAGRRSLLNKNPIGRPISLKVQQVAQHAAQLKQEHPMWSWGRIALVVCPKKGQPRHDCVKERCDNRIRQAAKRYLNP
jgi:hypothetical protein